MTTQKELPILPKGMGGYDYLPSGKIRFRKQVMLGVTKHSLSVTGNTIAEVNKKMAIKEKELENRFMIDQGEAVRALANGMWDWITMYKSKEVAPRSYDRLVVIFNAHIKDSILGKMQEPNITSNDIMRFLDSTRNKRTNEPLSYSSQKKIYELLNQYFKFKYRTKPNNNPMLFIKPPIKPVTEIDDEELIVYDDNELKIFMNEAKKPLVNGIEGYRYGLLFNFMIWSCLRIGEARALTWEDVDWNERTVKIHKAISPIKNYETGKIEQVITKTKNRKTRIVNLTEPAYTALKEYEKRVQPKSKKEYLFFNPSDRHSPLTNASIERAYYNIVKRAGLDYKHVTIHGLRHTGISALIRGGVPIEVVSRMAGHQSIQITTDIYYSVLEDQKANALKGFKFPLN